MDNKEAFMPENPVIVFMGTPDYAVPSLERLIENGYSVQAVVTQPDRPRGRKRKPAPPPVKVAALEAGLPVLQPQRASEGDFCDRISKLAPDLIIVVAFGQILSQALLDIPTWGALNIHASLLPRYRGAAPIQWAIINNEKSTGLTAMRMDAGLDTGPILRQEVCAIGPEETAGELHDRLSVCSGEFLLGTLEELKKGTLIEKKQDPEKGTYAPKIDKALGVIRWNASASRVSALIRGLDPWPGAATEISGKHVKLFSPRVMDDIRNEHLPGSVLGHSSDGLMVQAGEGIVAIRELQAPGKRRLSYADFLRGFPLPSGTILRDGGIRVSGNG
ncbi:MAG: methionyl-tRNA formyltransferase [Deltaproteobacteria bacterium]|nr:methionyl-tRNA formyltransferase [Deltaproteobacteria bacterium]